jgi:hypothetical protein
LGGIGRGFGGVAMFLQKGKKVAFFVLGARLSLLFFPVGVEKWSLLFCQIWTVGRARPGLVAWTLEFV